ncbi:MAG: hypothetical protein Q8755_03260, partial [Candidatus Phytoplasma australasiaticum]|nr:hypothetical protein [Candidatus Phytoplasma australasiaticum]
MLTNNETELKNTIRALRADNTDLQRTVILKQNAINSYIQSWEDSETQLQVLKVEHEALRKRLESYSNSQYVLDHFIEYNQQNARNKRNRSGIGYHQVPPPMNHNYTHLPDEDEMVR